MLLHIILPKSIKIFFKYYFFIILTKKISNLSLQLNIIQHFINY